MSRTPREMNWGSKATVTACRHSITEIRAVFRAVRNEWDEDSDPYMDDGEYDKLRVGNRRYQILGHGCSRTAIALCRLHVLKVDRNGCYDQTRGEVKFYQNADADLRRILAPIYAYGADFTWELVKRCESADDEWDRRSFYQKAEDYGIDDLGGSNIGRIGKRLVVLDYGLSDAYNGRDDENESSGLWFDTDSSSGGCDCEMCKGSS